MSRTAPGCMTDLSQCISIHAWKMPKRGTYTMADLENPQKLIALLRSLRAVRQFRPDPVPQEVVDAVLEVARWSGSASNRQPWEFVVIRKRETLQALAALEGYAGHLAGAPLGIVLVMAGESGQFEQETFDEGRLS